MAKATQALKTRVFQLAQSGLKPQDIVKEMPELSQATIYRYLRERQGSLLLVEAAKQLPPSDPRRAVLLKKYSPLLDVVQPQSTSKGAA